MRPQDAQSTEMMARSASRGLFMVGCAQRCVMERLTFEFTRGRKRAKPAVGRRVQRRVRQNAWRRLHGRTLPQERRRCIRCFPLPLHIGERRQRWFGRQRFHGLTDSGRTSGEHWFREALRGALRRCLRLARSEAARRRCTEINAGTAVGAVAFNTLTDCGRSSIRRPRGRDGGACI
jgi:hypothetical protein